jgi:hypothetical protein
VWEDKVIEFNGKVFYVEAKIYNKGSRFGINNGRISKMFIVNTETGKEIYNYDRGLDFDDTPEGLLDHVLKVFNN